MLSSQDVFRRIKTILADAYHSGEHEDSDNSLTDNKSAKNEERNEADTPEEPSSIPGEKSQEKPKLSRKESEYPQVNAKTFPKYDYDGSKLLPGQSSIRILELLPGRIEDPIRCSLKAHPLEKTPVYEALSYVWGDPKGWPIEVDGCIHELAPISVRTALRHLRYEDVPRRLWIDSICINQDDLIEKQQQIGLLKDIYKRAVKIVIWLAAASPDSKATMRYFEVLARATEFYHPPLTCVGVAERVAAECGYEVEWVQTCLTNDLLSQTDDVNATYVAYCEWFWRAWTVQEVLLASKAELTWGWDRLEWDLFCRGVQSGIAMNLLVVNCFGLQDDFEASNITFLVNYTPNTDASVAERLLDVLLRFRRRHAKLPQDKIFAFFGMVPEHESIGLRADYKISASEVYRHVTTQLLTHMDTLDVLGTANSTLCLAIDEVPLASWAADWRRRIPAPPLESVKVEKHPRFLGRTWSHWRNHGVVGKATAKKPGPGAVASSAEPQEEPTREVYSAEPFRTYCKGAIRPNLATPGTSAVTRFENDGRFLVLEGFVFDELTDVSDLVPSYIEIDLYQDHLRMYDVLAEANERFEQVDDSSVVHVITEAFRVYGHFFERVLKIILWLVKPIETYIRWEKFANVKHETGPEADRYWQAITAGNWHLDGPDAYEQTQQEFRKWYRTLKDLRRLQHWHLTRPNSEIQLMAFMAYARGNWTSTSTFAELLKHTEKRRLARTKSGGLALVSVGAQPGDQLALCKGGKVPLTVRPKSTGLFTFVGECYVHEVMDGKAFREELCHPMRFE